MADQVSFRSDNPSVDNPGAVTRKPPSRRPSGDHLRQSVYGKHLLNETGENAFTAKLRRSDMIYMSANEIQPFNYKKYKKKKEREKEKAAERAKKTPDAPEIIPLCDSLPILQHSRTVIFRSENQVGEKRQMLHIETIDGSKVAKLYYLQKGKRVLLDAKNKVSAIITRHKTIAGRCIFKVSGGRPMHPEHLKSHDTRHFTWAEIENTGALGIKFRMIIQDDYTKNQTHAIDYRFDAKRFGPSILSACCPKKKSPRGYSIRHETKDGKKYDGCGRLTFYRDFRSVFVSKNMDFGLMLCFIAIMDEMIERRIR